MTNKFVKKLVMYPLNSKFHTIYDSTIKMFREKYPIVYNYPKRSEMYWINNNLIVRKFYRKFIELLRKKGLRKKDCPKVKKTTDNLFFCFNELPPEGYDFVLDLEIITGLCGYDYSKLDKNYIQKRLSSDHCKKIICWNKICYDSLTKIIDCSSFINKISILSPTRKMSKTIPRKSSKKINLLFVSSINNPQDFEGKGGLIVLEVFSKLSKKYPFLKLNIRAKVSKNIRKKYRKVRGLKFILKYLSKQKMEELFLNSDILLEPVPGIALLLDCMNYGIPAISYDFWCIPEYISDKKTGFLIKSSQIFGNPKKDMENYIKNFSEKRELFSKSKPSKGEIIKFYSKTEELILDSELLKKMSSNQRKRLNKTRDFSFDKRVVNLEKQLGPLLR